MSSSTEAMIASLRRQKPNYTIDADTQAAVQKNLVDRQTSQNRINQYNPFGSLTYNADGSQHSGLSGEQQDIFNLQEGNATRAAQGMASPFSFGSMPELNGGADAYDQAFGASINQARGRMDPVWNRRADATRTQLANQGLDVNSEAYRNAMSDFYTSRNDAYNDAFGSAMNQGEAAANGLFGLSLQGRQSSANEALQQRGVMANEYGSMLSGMLDTGVPSFAGYNSAGVAQAPNLLGAAQYQGKFDLGTADTVLNRDAQAAANAAAEANAAIQAAGQVANTVFSLYNASQGNGAPSAPKGPSTSQAGDYYTTRNGYA